MRRISLTPTLRVTTVPLLGTLTFWCAARGGAYCSQMRCSGTHRRLVRPTEEGVADLMEDGDEQVRSHVSTGQTASAKSSAHFSAIAEAASLYRRAASMSTGENEKQSEKGKGRGPVDDVDANAVQRTVATKLYPDSMEAEAENDALREEAERSEAHVLEQQQYYYELPVQTLTDIATAYLRSTENVALVSVQEEHILFPVLLDRLQEFHVSQLLDIIDCHWSRSTMLRYGTRYKDMVRDRIAQLATAAATQLEAKGKRQQEPKASPSTLERAAVSDTALGEARQGEDRSAVTKALDEENDDDDGAVFVSEKQAADSQRSADAILTHADKEITAATVYRALVVMGLSAGHRKRDLPFFQLLGNYFAFFINDYRDPHDLVRVLTSLARAKIVPSPAFLNMIARRMPVLHKRIPLEPLPAYRALSNFSRMGHTSMNTFRFLADCMFAHIEKYINAEKKQRRTKPAASGQPASPATTSEAKGSAPSVSATEACTDLSQTYSPDVLEKARLHRMCGLKPSMFTRWLAILARFNAPHQQYLRPLIKPVILPMLPYFPPPSFTRLVSATRVFKSTDGALVDALVERVCNVLAPAGTLTRDDAMELLRLISQEDTPVPAQLDRVFRICKEFLGSSTSVFDPKEGDENAANPQPCGIVTVVPRPRDMCTIVKIIGSLQRKDEIPLESLTPLLELTEDFARRLAYLMDLYVVSLAQVESFLELCERHQIPDASGALERLMLKRRDVILQMKRSPDAAAADTQGVGPVADSDEAEEAYYSQLDIDVREIFNKILLTNDWNTHCRYKPLPGPLQVDFRNELTKVSALELLKAVDLFAKACPGALRDAPRLFLSRSLLEKVGKDGEVVVEEETNTLVIRQPRAELLTREDLEMFTELVQRTPLEAVRTAPVVWNFIQEKAERLGLISIEATARQRLNDLHSA